MSVVDICSLKNRLRESFKQERKAMQPDRKAEFDKRITCNVMSLEQFRQCNLLLIYVSTDIEVDTHELIKHALAQGKKVAIPRCTSSTDMGFYFVDGMEELDYRAFVPEPVAHCRPVKNFEKSLCIVPALCYDLYGYRLGYGRGYYDRFLSSYSSTAIGIVYSDFVCKKLPHGRFDRRVELIVTQDYIKRACAAPKSETGGYYFNKTGKAR